ncbi:RagB/SusD family nutrient uptake outer membrane protein [Sphingobacterium sp. JB170]|uniref:RagB/SusD family nutrient uptake outer membrane protein n=1 Tax=Sphingobacterium sp. JB170 TaxID=1434842 RepID=UPI00097EE7F6|nr:RagB/SusD family nutrient uptake outer membrane protein [Sphingobacterium sp. JB170]SJN19077.1 SusD, outer membrane protein [Sphingobacterium sp. JB170]
MTFIKKIKKYNKLAVCVIASSMLAFSSCDNFLELSPADQVSGTTFFKTEADFMQALHAAYNPLRKVGVDFYTSEMRSDNTHYEYNPGNQGTAIYMRQDIADFTNNSSNDYSAEIYYNAYQGISRSNVILDRLETAGLATEVTARIEGQARFLRAFYYFKLVRYFGKVPLYIHEVSDESGAFQPRAEVDAVYAQIIEDASKAVEVLAQPTEFPQDGYATKGSATMLLGEVYATRKEYAKAEALLKSLSGMGYELLANYGDVFSTKNKNSKESILEVQFMEGLESGMQSNFIYVFLPRIYNTALITFGVQANNTSNTGGGWNTPTQGMIEAYEPGDTRLEASIGIAEGTYDVSSYFTLEAQRKVTGYTAPAGKVGVPFIKKYLNPHTSPNNTDDNWPVYRYAGALLLLAEVQNEQGKTGEALENLNRVRRRALPNSADLTASSKQIAKELILKERRVELAFENHRWFDLLRSGQAVEVLNKHGESLREIHDYLSAESYKVNEDKLLFPIPFAEIGVNTLLDQNAGY